MKEPFRYQTIDGVWHTCRCGACRQLAQQELDEAFQMVMKAPNPFERFIAAIHSWCVTLVHALCFRTRPSQHLTLPPLSDEFLAAMDTLNKAASGGKISMMAIQQAGTTYQPTPEYEDMLLAAPDWHR